jgi:hypothetical protein
MSGDDCRALHGGGPGGSEAAAAGGVTVSGYDGGAYSAAEKELLMRAALAVAARALSRQEVPVGCVVVFMGAVVAEGALRGKNNQRKKQTKK